MHTNVVLKHDYNERMYIVVIIHIHELTTYIYTCTKEVYNQGRSNLHNYAHDNEHYLNRLPSI